jgi:hypothetical protein
MRIEDNWVSCWFEDMCFANVICILLNEGGQMGEGSHLLIPFDTG